MTTDLKFAAELCAFSFLFTWYVARLNHPYPFNSNALDYCEGLGVLTFVPAFLYTIARGIWLI